MPEDMFGDPVEVTTAVEPIEKTAIRNKTIALALGDKLPVDSMGYPIGLSDEKIAQRLRPPVGVTRREWLTALETASEYFRMTSGLVDFSEDCEAMKSISSMEPRKWEIIYRADNIDTWHSALAMRGIMRKGSGLTFDQMRALRYLTDITQKGDIHLRLKKLGITWETFQSWMRDKKFSEQFNAVAEEVLDQAQAPVLMALTRGAVEGNLQKIQYFHQVTNKFQPEDKSKADVEKFMVGLVEILQGTLSEHPDILREIAGRLTDLKTRTIGAES